MRLSTYEQLQEYSEWSMPIDPADFIDLQYLAGKQMRCTCGNTITLRSFRAYEHEGGIRMTGTGIDFWVFHPCFKCGYDWAWHKISRRLI